MNEEKLNMGKNMGFC